ncbi:hypothetical protein [Shinella zoogloeoides]|nr:hypothetical protein [Shinella zoogloeoides]WLR92147.1 hypothetical protein Q9316_17020 [Shinella zoogloeoides]
MIEAFIYAAVFSGLYECTGRFWFSLGWPYHAGRLLGGAFRSEQKDTDHG